MTKRDLIEQLHQYPDDTVLWAFNGDDMAVMPVTGLLFVDEPNQGGPNLEFCTDEP